MRLSNRVARGRGQGVDAVGLVPLRVRSVTAVVPPGADAGPLLAGCFHLHPTVRIDAEPMMDVPLKVAPVRVTVVCPHTMPVSWMLKCSTRS